MRQRWRVPAAAGGAAALLLSGCTYKGATAQGQQIHTLYGIIFALAALVFVLVEGLLVWSIVRFRKRDDAPAPQSSPGELRETHEAPRTARRCSLARLLEGAAARRPPE